MKIIEISDDLTGAADSSSYFSARGKNVRISVSGRLTMKELDQQDDEMTSINLSSRNIQGDIAKNLHCQLMKSIGRPKDAVIFKKIGTGFRGNDAKELDGLLSASDDWIIFVIDNAPDLGTFTLYGNQYCEGELLTKSLYAKDPILPPKDSYIPRILSEGIPWKVELVDIDSVKGSKILEKTTQAVSEGKRIIVFDAVSRQDTTNIINSLFDKYPNAIWTGSLGLADSMAQYLLGDWIETVFQKRSIRCLGFCASAYEIAWKQIKYSEKRGLHIIKIDIDSLIDGNCQIINRTISDAKTSIKNYNTMVVPYTKKFSYQRGTSEKILEAVYEVAQELCRNCEFDRLVLVGGETSQNVFKACKTSWLELGSPLAPGVTQGRVVDGVIAGKEFSMKGGSMGSEDILEKMMSKMEVRY